VTIDIKAPNDIIVDPATFTVGSSVCQIPIGQDCGRVVEPVGGGKNAGGDDLMLVWNPVSGATQYEVQRCAGSNCVSQITSGDEPVEPTDPSITISGKKALRFFNLADNTGYDLRVRVSSSTTCAPPGGWSTTCSLSTKWDCDQSTSSLQKNKFTDSNLDFGSTCGVVLTPLAKDVSDGSELITLYSNDYPTFTSEYRIDDAPTNPDDCNDLRFTVTPVKTTPSVSPSETLPSLGAWPSAAGCSAGISCGLPGRNPISCPSFGKIGNTCYFGGAQCCNTVQGGLCVVVSSCTGGGCYYNQRCTLQPGQECRANGCVSGDLSVTTNILGKKADHTLDAGYNILTPTCHFNTGSETCLSTKDELPVRNSGSGTKTYTLTFCGDGGVQDGACGEVCDPPGTCSPTETAKKCNSACSGYVSSCGDGQTNCGEECDASNPNDPNKNDCDSTCKLKKECVSNADCVNKGIKCGAPLGNDPNRFAGCNLATNKCTICDPCTVNTDCVDNTCCGSTSAGGPGGSNAGKCIGHGVYSQTFLCKK